MASSARRASNNGVAAVMFHCTRFGSGAYASIGTVTNRTLPALMPLTLDASFRIVDRLSSSSVEIDLVAALRNAYVLAGSVSSEDPAAFLTTAAMNFCCRWIRSMSEPLPSV